MRPARPPPPSLRFGNLACNHDSNINNHNNNNNNNNNNNHKPEPPEL